MDWKSTAVISGAGVLATWFFSMPAAQVPPTASATHVTAVAPAARSAADGAAEIDIQQEAERLQVRARPEPQYAQPSRNPFRFSEGKLPPAAARAGAGTVAAPPITAPVVPLALPPPRLALDGIAADNVDGKDQRTAIINTDAGEMLVKEGDQVAGYRVSKIATDAVELMKIDDGSVLRLGLR
jgi:hypothetical protein